MEFCASRPAAICGGARASSSVLNTGTSEETRVTSRSTRFALEPATNTTCVSRPATCAKHSSSKSMSSTFKEGLPEKSTTTGDSETRRALSNSFRSARLLAELDAEGKGKMVHAAASTVLVFTAVPDAKVAPRRKTKPGSKSCSEQSSTRSCCRPADRHRSWPG